MKTKSILLSIGLPIAILATALTAAITLGGPGTPPPMPSINDPFKGVSFVGLPALSRFTARDGVPLSCRAYAPSDTTSATPARGSVVLVHGSSASSNSMHPMAQAFAQAGYAVFALDIRGHGESGTKGRIGYVGQLEDDLEDFVKAVSPPKPSTLVGVHSFDGLPVSRFALNEQAKAFLTPEYTYGLASNFRPKADYVQNIKAMELPARVLAGTKDEAFFTDRLEEVFRGAGSAIPVTLIPDVGHIPLTLEAKAIAAAVKAVETMRAGGV